MTAAPSRPCRGRGPGSAASDRTGSAGGASALAAAMVLLLAHALYKGALFLVAGIVDHETGTRDVASLGGLFRSLPATGVAAAAAAFSMAGEDMLPASVTSPRITRERGGGR